MQANDVKISIALCTFNGTAFLPQQLQSFIDQTRLPDEIVVCDDRSTDQTVEILQKFAAAHDGISWKVTVNEETLGPLRNFEKALGLCSGDVLFLSDQDDLWGKQKLEIMTQHLVDNRHCEAVFSNATIIDAEGRPIGNDLWSVYHFDDWKKYWNTPKILHDLLFRQNKITGCTMAITRSLYQRALPFPKEQGDWHDQWLALNASTQNGLCFIDACLIDYREHPLQQVGLGHGVSLAANESSERNTGLKAVFDEYKTYAARCRTLWDRFFPSYPAIGRKQYESEISQMMAWLEFRVQLPSSFFSRLFVVAGKREAYYVNSPTPLRSLLRDIFNPAIKGQA